mgnify:CR=1 FL=1
MNIILLLFLISGLTKLAATLQVGYLITFIYLWLTVVVIWSGSYSKSGVGEKPLILESVVFQFVFNMITLAWFILTIYLLIFVSWKFVLFFLLFNFIYRFSASFVDFLEAIVLFPFKVITQLLLK